MTGMRRRSLVVLMTLALVAAACGDDDDAVVGPDGSTTSVAPGEAPGTTAAGEPGSDPGGEEEPGDQATTVPAAAPDTSGPPGSAAPFYLRPQPAGAIVIEVSAELGAEPPEDAIQHVANVLIGVSGKGVTVTSGGTLPSREVWTSSELRSAADIAATTSQGDRAVVRLLFVRGGYAESDSVLGVAVRGDVAAVFTERVHDAASPLVGSGAIFAAVITHEAGHLLGLVDLHLSTGREDAEHPGHSTNRNSVMYWAVESTLITDILTGGPPRDFDEADRVDLAAIRNGA